MSARSKRLLEMALGVETDSNTSEKECPVYNDIDNNSVSMIYDTDSTSSSCMTAPEPKFFKDKDGGLWHPTSNFEETNLHVCSGKQSDVLLTTNFNSRSLVENMSDVQKEKPFDIYDFSDAKSNHLSGRNKENIIPLSIDFDNFNAGQSVKYTEKGTNSYTIICSESTNDNAYFNIDSAEKPSDVAIKLRRQKEITNTSPKKKISDIASLTESETDYSDDNIRDKDFDVNCISECDPNSDESIKSKLSESLNIDASQNDRNINTRTLSDSLKIQRKNYHDKKVRCKFCEEDISSRNFVRHVIRHHNHEREVNNILEFPVKSKQRRQAFDRLKGSTNFEMYLKGAIRPKKQRTEDTNVEYYPCIYCKALFSKKYLNRHAKICPVKNNSTTAYGKSSQITLSQTAVACALDPNDVISKLNIKEQVFDMMKGDEISFVAKKDLLIAHYGESYLKSQKGKEKNIPVATRCASWLDYLSHTGVVSATRILAGFHPIAKTYEAPSTSLHMGTSLKIISNELIHLILKRSPGFTCESPEKSLEWRKNVKNFKMLVETRWNSEISSVANKNLNEKRWENPLLIPLIDDVRIFREKTLEFAKDCQKTWSVDEIAAIKKHFANNLKEGR
nr:unnamed protein product [Callosobruchus analis]